ncbi:MAG: hypothetical protein ACM3QS_09310, partial [Bacteroidota bacterium]
MVKSPPMKRMPALLSLDDWVKLLLGITLFFSLAVRIFPPLLAGFPINDGGMFLVMMRDLRANGFVLPVFTSYNLSRIPYAYPPLGFYAGGILSVLGVPDLEVLRWLPAIVNAASVPAFYLLAQALLKDRPRAAVAAMVYGLVPGNFAWQIMGGGLTRSFGILFIILANYSVLKMFQLGAWKYAVLSALFCSLAVLSHPEAGLATAASCGLFWLFFGRTRPGAIQAAAVAVGTIILTAPWWGTVLAFHGLPPFLAVLHSGAYIVNPLKELAANLFTFDPWTGLFRLLVLAGIGWNLYRRQFFLPLWLALPYVTEPRSAPAFAHFPGSIMAAQVLMDLVPLLVDRIRRRQVSWKTAPPDLSGRDGYRLALLGLSMLWFLQSGFYGYVLVNTSLRLPEPLQAMEWASRSSASGSEFLILTGSTGIMSDPIQEWFPAIAGRNSVTTLQGMEWTLGEKFFPRLKRLIALQGCQDIRCVESWSAETGLRYSHLMIEKNKRTGALLQSVSSDA